MFDSTMTSEDKANFVKEWNKICKELKNSSKDLNKIFLVQEYGKKDKEV